MLIEGVNGNESEETILEKLNKYGITRSIVPSSNRSLVSVEIWGSGKPMREFLWSEEMAEACVFVMENVDFDTVISTTKEEKSQTIKGDSFPSAEGFGMTKSDEIRNTHINIGTGKEISIRGLAELVKKTIGFQGELVFNASKPDGTMRKLTDPSKLHGLGWHHKIEIEEGIYRMYEWYTKV